MEKINHITKELEITGRGKVLVCENCYYEIGDIISYNNFKYEITGIELQGHKEPPYKIAGLVVKTIKKI